MPPIQAIKYRVSLSLSHSQQGSWSQLFMFLGVLGFFSLPHPTILVTCLLGAGKYAPNNTPLKVLCFTYELKTNSRAERFLSPRSSRNPRPRAEFVSNNPYAIQLVSLNSRRLARVRPSWLPHSTAGWVSASPGASPEGLRGGHNLLPNPRPKIWTVTSPTAQEDRAHSLPSPAQGRSLLFTVLYHQLANAMATMDVFRETQRETRGTRRGHGCSAAKGHGFALHLPQTWLGLTL